MRTSVAAPAHRGRAPRRRTTVAARMQLHKRACGCGQQPLRLGLTSASSLPSLCEVKTDASGDVRRPHTKT
jgi:hypothetical protein